MFLQLLGTFLLSWPLAATILFIFFGRRTRVSFQEAVDGCLPIIATVSILAGGAIFSL